MTFILLLFGVMLFFVYLSRPDDKPVLAVLTVSYLYYCIGGTIYWVFFQDAYFAGMLWGTATIIWAAQLLALATVLLAGLILFFSTWQKERIGTALLADLTSPRLGHPDASRMPRTYWVLIAVGIVSTVYVLANGSFSALGGLDRARSPFILIAYQFSDLLIPIICYTIAVRGYSKTTVLLIVYFVMYVVLVGFRYKLAILFIPLLFDQLLNRPKVVMRHLTLGFIGTVGLALFTLMTLYRTKFGVPDFSVRLENPYYDFFYGVFAESNVLFGLSSILRSYVDAGIVNMTDPVADVFKEWLPRILFPSRVSGEYLIPMQNAFSTLAGISSGTAYPWIGEFLIMFNYYGLVIGPASLALIYVYLRNKLRRFSWTRRQYIIGLATLAAMLGFYHFSRGYLPQIAKGYIFVVVPYLYLCYVTGRGRMSAFKRNRRVYAVTRPQEPVLRQRGAKR